MPAAHAFHHRGGGLLRAGRRHVEGLLAQPRHARDAAAYGCGVRGRRACAQHGEVRDCREPVDRPDFIARHVSPGGILAVATMDLAYADIVSGASRFVLGLVQLLFLVLGMIIAASLAGLPPERLLVESTDERLVSWALWLGVLCFGVGNMLHYSAEPRALPWMLLVLAIAMAAQLAGNAAFGGYVSGFIGALFVTLVSSSIQYRLGGPAAMVTFLPGLWLLVPGSLGLLGLAEVATDNHLAGLENFSTTLFSIVAIALGSLMGSGLYNVFFDPIFRRAGSMAESVRRRFGR